MKGDRWEMVLLRPEEVDETWISFDPETGELYPAEDLDPLTACRVEVTLALLGLDDEARRQARKRVWRAMLNASKHPEDHGTLADYVTHGPYRFVAERYLAAQR